MDKAKIQAIFEPMYFEFTNLAMLKDTERPLHLAHYTSLEVLEKIISNNEIWFSNPLFMNDHQEMRYGITEGIRLISLLQQDGDAVAQAGGADNLNKIILYFNNALAAFDINHSFDVYIFCLSQYLFDQPDGSLSMWRGYGANGQGAALVFNTSFINVVPGSPLFIGKVNYLSSNQRSEWISNTFRKCLSFLKEMPDTDEARNVVGTQMFRLCLMHALTAKHPGFSEENEWRVIYFPDMDIHELMKDRFGYLRRGNSIEPKLKFPIEPLHLEPRQAWTFESILDRIVLGPTHATNLARNSARRMLQNLGKPQFVNKLWVSEIPYRPLG